MCLKPEDYCSGRAVLGSESAVLSILSGPCVGQLRAQSYNMSWFKLHIKIANNGAHILPLPPSVPQTWSDHPSILLKDKGKESQ